MKQSSKGYLANPYQGQYVHAVILLRITLLSAGTNFRGYHRFS